MSTKKKVISHLILSIKPFVRNWGKGRYQMQIFIAEDINYNLTHKKTFMQNISTCLSKLGKLLRVSPDGGGGSAWEGPGWSWTRRRCGEGWAPQPRARRAGARTCRQGRCLGRDEGEKN